MNREALFTCTGQTLHISSTHEACSHMIPWYSAPPPHWCCHSRRFHGGFWSAHPESQASPPRFAPSLCCGRRIVSLSLVSVYYFFFYLLLLFLRTVDYYFYSLAKQFRDVQLKDCTIMEEGKRKKKQVEKTAPKWKARLNEVCPQCVSTCD